jgi:hypothetical protein
VAAVGAAVPVDAVSAVGAAAAVSAVAATGAVPGSPGAALAATPPTTAARKTTPEATPMTAVRSIFTVLLLRGRS